MNEMLIALALLAFTVCLAGMYMVFVSSLEWKRCQLKYKSLRDAKLRRFIGANTNYGKIATRKLSGMLLAGIGLLGILVWLVLVARSPVV